MSKVTAVIFLGGIGGSPVTDMVANCQRAITRDTIERIQQTDVIDKVILVAERPERMPSVVIEPSGRPFHFGRKLREVIEKYHIETPFYIGGGSSPLLPSSGVKNIAKRIASTTDTVITNNPFSSDLVAFNPGKAIEAIELPATDNPLAQRFVTQAGLRPVALPRTARYQFDVDTPTDLLILKLHPGAGRHTREYLDSLHLDSTRLEQAVQLLADANAQITVAGRVGSHVWSQLEHRTSCRVRLLAEERSMSADERAKRGEVRTILGFYLEQVGMDRFFEALAQLGHAAFIDTRVLFTHFGLNPSADDRFHSDLGQHDKIKDPFIRELTRKSLEASIPVILGGHSLVSGGLLALIEIAHHKTRGKRLTQNRQ